MNWPRLLECRGFAFVLLAVWGLAYLPNLGTRTLRLEEGRRATPAREMLASGDFVRPTLYGETYLSKPPLYFWMVAAVGAVFGEVNPLAVRIPSVLAALGCALIAYRFAPQTLDRRTRALAAIFVLASAALLDKGTLGEIDATLCFFVAAALKFWWDGNRPQGETTAGWALSGLMLGVAAMLKGPAGPAIFYLTIVPYLVRTGRWQRLFTIGHLGCLALAVLPSACWVVALVDREVISTSELLVVWRVQLGGDYAAASLADPSGQMDRIVNHYVSFPLPVIGLLLPAVLWLPFALSRRWSVSHGVPTDLRLLLLCGVICPCLAFYLYPESRPRHLMAAFFPMAILAAVVVSHFGVRRCNAAFVSRLNEIRETKAALHRRTPKEKLHLVASALCFLPVILAGAGLALTVAVRPGEITCSALVLCAGIAWSLISLCLTRNTPREFGVLSAATTFLALPLTAWFVFNSVVIPWKAPTNSARGAEALSTRLPPHEVVYTTRTFPTKGDRYFNLQFHLAKNLRAANDLEDVKRAAPCLAVVTPDERAEMESTGWLIEEIGRIGGTPGAPPEVHVVRVRALLAE